MPKQLGHHGFSTLILILAVVLLMILGFGGWYLWERQDESGNLQQNTVDKRQQLPATEMNTGRLTSDPSENGKYLVIKEWNIRIKLPKDIGNGIYYIPDSENSESMVIDSTAFPRGAECLSFSIFRTKKPVTNATDPDGFNSSSIAQIGMYYYSRITGSIACSSDQDVQDEAAALQRQLYESASTIEALP